MVLSNDMVSLMINACVGGCSPVIGWMKVKANEQHSLLSLSECKGQIKCRTKDCNQPKGHQLINK